MIEPTTILDVIEDQLGIELCEANLPQLTRLRREDLRTLGEVLYEHSDSEYLQLPSFVPPAICVVGHWNGPINRALGGTGFGSHQILPHPSVRMLGSLYHALLYFPRVALWDGLEYFLDYFRDAVWWQRENGPTEEYRSAVLELLTFYARTRELSRKGDLVVIPRTIWGDIRTCGGSKYPGSFFSVAFSEPSARLLLLRRLSQRNGIVARAEQVAGVSIASLEKAYMKLGPESFIPEIDSIEPKLRRQMIAAHRVFVSVEAEIDDLMRVNAHFGYVPAFDTSSMQQVFESATQAVGDSLVEHGGSAHHSVFESVTRVLGALRPADFVAVRESGAFGRFRDTLEAIAAESSSLSDAPIDQEETVRRRLQAAQEEVEKEIAASRFLNSVATSAMTVGIGALCGSGFAGLIDPEWHRDPTRHAVVGGAAAVIGAVVSYLRKTSERRDCERLTMIYGVLREACGQD